jgi:hypothetical protein
MRDLGYLLCQTKGIENLSSLGGRDDSTEGQSGSPETAVFMLAEVVLS